VTKQFAFGKNFVILSYNLQTHDYLQDNIEENQNFHYDDLLEIALNLDIGLRNLL